MGKGIINTAIEVEAKEGLEAARPVFGSVAKAVEHFGLECRREMQRLRELYGDDLPEDFKVSVHFEPSIAAGGLDQHAQTRGTA